MKVVQVIRLGNLLEWLVECLELEGFLVLVLMVLLQVQVVLLLMQDREVLVQ